MKFVRRNRFQRFWLRLVIAIKILRKDHGIVIFLDKKQMETLVFNDSVSGVVECSYFGMLQHQMGRVVKHCGNCIDDVDILCGRAEFDSNFTINDDTQA